MSQNFSASDDSQKPQVIAAQMTRNTVNGAGKTIGLILLLSAILMTVVGVGFYLLMHQVATIGLSH